MNAKLLLLLALAPMLPVAAQNSGPTPNVEALRRVVNGLVPDGIVVDEIKLEGMQATISGHTPDNSKVSDFLRSIDSSPVLEMPQVQQIVPVDGESEFVLTTVVQCPTASDAAINPCGATSTNPTVHKCVVNDVVTFQSTPCPDS